MSYCLSDLDANKHYKYACKIAVLDSGRENKAVIF